MQPIKVVDVINQVLNSEVIATLNLEITKNGLAREHCRATE
jgi:hypothetical protein